MPTSTSQVTTNSFEQYKSTRHVSSDDIQRIKLVRDCKEAREDISKFAKFIFDWDMKEFHLKWHKTVDVNNRTLILAPAGHAKCLGGNELLYMPDGQRVMCKDWKGGYLLALNSMTNNIEPAFAPQSALDGIKPCLKIKTSSGKNITVSYNHPILCSIRQDSRWLETEAWIEAQCINVEDMIGVENNGKLSFESVISVEKVGEQEVYDISVPTHHNFVAQGIISHNTANMALLRPLWELGKNPDLRIKMVSQSDERAKDSLGVISEMIEFDPKLQMVFPHLKPSERSSWTKNKLFIERTGKGIRDASIEACGVLSSATGARADLIIFDDICDFRNTIERASLRDKIKQVVKSVWISMLGPEGKGRAIYICTLWHQDDCSHELMKNKKWLVLNDSINENCDSIWPELWPKSALLDRKEEIGEREFNRRYRNIPYAEEDLLMTEEVLQECFVYRDLPPQPKDGNYFTGVDLAKGSGKSENNSVIFTLRVNDEGERIPVSIIKGRYSSPDIARLLIETYNDYNPRVIFVENNSLQQSIIEWIEEMGGRRLPIEGFRTGEKKFDPEVGVPMLRVEMEKHKWKIYVGKNPHSDQCQCGQCSWFRELKTFPFGKTSDCVMASYFATQAARRMTAEPRIRLIGV